MNKSLLLALLALLSCLSLHAQSSRDSIAVYGNVMDSFTHEMLKGVRITVMRSDSTVVGEYTTDREYRSGGYKHNFDQLGYLYLLRADHIFRFAKEGYATHYLHLRQRDLGRRETRRFLGEILLKKLPKRREVELGEVAVRTSKIRMVVKGDTLVYNADAFQLSEGSMLDGLMKLLPGFQLRDGQILVNGQYVSSLLVNGEDFFRGDPRVALENLPAYMVNKVKVYRKEHPWSHITNDKKVNKEELPLVVDVHLKREYAIGWVGNAAVGYGTEERYRGRIFGLRFTDHTRLALFGNLNNTNDTSQPGTSGDWKADGRPLERKEMQTAGLDFLVKGDKDTWKYTGNAKFSHHHLHDQSIFSSETFQPTLPNSTFSRVRRASESQQWQVETEQRYEQNKANRSFNLSGRLGYLHQRYSAWSARAEFSAHPLDAYRGASLDSLFSSSSERLAKMLVHQRRNEERGREHLWSAKVSASSYHKIPRTPDYVNWSFHANVEHKRGRSFAEEHLRYGQPSMLGRSERQLRYATAPEWKLDANLRAEYAYRPEWAWVRPYLELASSYRNGERNFYRLDRLGSDAPQFGMLPSTTAALMQSLDAPNSYTLQSHTLSVKWGTSWSIWLGGQWPSHRIAIEPIVQWRLDHLAYHRDALHVSPHRGRFLFTPKLSWGFDNCYLNYELQSADPDLLSLQDDVDNANPLNLRRGNPDLERSTTHKITFTRSWNNRKRGRHIRLSSQWDATRNAIAHGQTYDVATGVRTFMPRNVDGNWHSSIALSAEMPFDAKQQTLFSTRTQADFHNSVDYVTERSSVRNFTVSEELRVNAKLGRHILDLSVGARYWNATSKRASFVSINSFDFTYGLNAQIALPAGVALAAEGKLYQRTGYSDASMNDLHFVANARLEKAFLHGRLGISLEGFDIFSGLSNVHKLINAQGIVESWYNSLPPYAMLQLSYKLSKEPKKRGR